MLIFTALLVFKGKHICKIDRLMNMYMHFYICFYISIKRCMELVNSKFRMLIQRNGSERSPQGVLQVYLFLKVYLILKLINGLCKIIYTF